MTRSTLATTEPTVEPDDETTAAIAALDAAEQAIRATRKLLACRRPSSTTDTSAWLTLAETHRRTGIRESRGADPHRTLKDFLRARSVVTTRAGRALLVDRTSLEAALAEGAKRPAMKAPTSARPGDSAERALRKAGMRLVGR